MITSTTLYRRRGMSRQRDHDTHYLIPAAGLVALALATAANPVHTELLAFGVYLPLTCFWASWNDTRQMSAGRVHFWRDSNYWMRSYSIGITLVPVGQLTLAFGALPTYLTAAISVGWVDRLLWTPLFLALAGTLVYTLLGITLASIGQRTWAWGTAYVLGVEVVGATYVDLLAWFSPTAWIRAAAGIDGPLSTLAGWILLGVYLPTITFLGSVAVLYPHRYKFSQYRKLATERGWREEDDQ